MTVYSESEHRQAYSCVAFRGILYDDVWVERENDKNIIHFGDKVGEYPFDIKQDYLGVQIFFPRKD